MPTKKTDKGTSPKVAKIASKTLKDPKATKDEKSLAASALANAPDKPKTKAKPKKVEPVIEPARYTPMIGELCEMSGKLITIQCFDPFEAKEWFVMNNVVCDRPFTEPDFDNVRPVDNTEKYARLS